MTYLYSKTDIYGNPRSNRERLTPAMDAVDHAIRLMLNYQYRLRQVSEYLTDEELQTLCDAADAVASAASNAANLGWSGYEPIEVKTVRWRD